MEVQLHDKTFVPFLDSKDLESRIKSLAQDINRFYKGKKIHAFCILKGSFMFFSELMKYIDCDVQIHFLRVKSYEGTSTTGNVRLFNFDKEELPLNSDILIVEDIVDTGNTLDFLFNQFEEFKPAGIKVCTMLFKPDAYKSNKTIDFAAFSIPNEFVVGFGLDYDELGRNLPMIYKLKNTNNA